MPAAPGPKSAPGYGSLLEFGAKAPPGMKLALVAVVLTAIFLGNSYFHLHSRLSARHAASPLLASRDGLLAVTKCPEQLKVRSGPLPSKQSIYNDY
jgi:hypothetical protein